jgi:hypothetical protein
MAERALPKIKRAPPLGEGTTRRGSLARLARFLPLWDECSQEPALLGGLAEWVRHRRRGSSHDWR